MAPVQVLNNSRRTGLAHEVAGLIAARGWQIVIVGNLQGAIPESTVYFAPGDRAAAEHLAREFTSIRRVEPNAAAGLRQSGITVVLTSDWLG
jgi:LytR cell envelope-related transcriptional attenuator